MAQNGFFKTAGHPGIELVTDRGVSFFLCARPVNFDNAAAASR